MGVEPLAGDDPVQVAGYRLRGRLGAGGMGRVFLAFTDGGRPVALKVIRPELGDDQDFRDRFRREVDAARRVHGLYTAQVLDADPGGSPPWLVTAYVPGPSLLEAVAAHGPLPAGTALLLMAGAAEALAAIHAAGIVHRDLKPSNVLLAADGPRVIDFGIARAVDATALTSTGVQVGTPAYMAPEQVEGSPVTPATDVFALGAVIGYGALGRAPFGTGNGQALLYRIVHQEPELDGCPDALRPLITRCLAKDPAQRPDPAEIITECRAHTAGQTLQIARSWLPAAVSEGLAGYAPPPQYTPPTQSAVGAPGAPGAAGAVPASSVSPVSPARPAPSAPSSHGWAPGGPAWPGPPPPAPPRPGGLGRGVRVPLGVIVAGVAVVAAAGAGTALAFALSPGNTDSGNGTRPTGGTSPSVAASGASATVAGTPGPSPSLGPDACLAGTWKSVNEVSPETIGGQQAVFSGSGGQAIFLPDGQYTLTYDNVVLSASVNGVNWTETLDGVVTAHWTAENGSLQFTSVVQNVSDVYYENGTYNSSVRPTLATTVPFLCSGDTLSESSTTGTSDQYTRVAGNS